MSPNCSFLTLLILFSVIISMECAITNRSNKHAHNVIHKEEKTTNNTITEEPADNISTITPIDTQGISRSEDDIVNSSNRRRTSLKIRIPLHHQDEKKLSTIKHPLPKRMHDIMPHEPPRHSIVDQHKVHHDFLHLEGPKLQRRLHHHFTVEEIRQRRKELKEKLLARHKKLAHVTPRGPFTKDEEILILPIQITEKMPKNDMDDQSIKAHLEEIPRKIQKEYILRKQKHFFQDDNKLDNNFISSEEVAHPEETSDHPTTDFLLYNQLKHPEANTLAITNPITSSTSTVDREILTTPTEANTEGSVGSIQKPNQEYETAQDELTRKKSINNEAQSNMLLDYLRKKYRVSSKLNHQTPTTPSMETTTWSEISKNVSHEKFISRLKYILGERGNNLTSTDSSAAEKQYESIEQTTMVEKGEPQTESSLAITSPAVYISRIKKFYSTSTSKPQENENGIIEEPEMYQDWRAHLRKAIRRRLHELHENPETK